MDASLDLHVDGSTKGRCRHVGQLFPIWCAGMTSITRCWPVEVSIQECIIWFIGPRSDQWQQYTRIRDTADKDVSKCIKVGNISKDLVECGELRGDFMEGNGGS